MEYSRQVVALILEHREQIDSIKYRVTANLIPDSFTGTGVNNNFSEGHTLDNIGPRTTRTPKNTNRMVENLSDVTSDIDVALKNALDDAERMAVGLRYSGMFEEFTPEVLTLATTAVDKITDWLNGYRAASY